MTTKFNFPVNNVFKSSDTKFLKEDDLDLSFLIGKTIVNLGTLDQKCAKGKNTIEGGLAIDYKDNETDKNTKRVILGYTELGMWLGWKGKIEKNNG